MIQIEHLSKSFKTADGTVEALKDITLTVPDGEIFGIIGMSGAGKSTLVRCINMLERPTEGRVIIDGCDISALPAKQLREMRRSITMIFQGFNLLMQRNCLKNVCFPMELAGIPAREAEARAKELPELVGLGDKLKAYPAQLSGGQQQRVAIARALATHPRILLCDEATSALDPQSTQSILALIRDIHDKLGLTVIVITHQMSVVEQICTQVAILDNGAVAEVGPGKRGFCPPPSQAAKRLVYPEGYDQPIASPGEHLIRIVFNGADSAKTPLIAHMAMHENIAASIVSASTRSIGGKTYGNMLLGIPGGAEELRRAMDYLGGTPDIIVEEVKPDEH